MYRKYKLKISIPGLPAGVIFEHRDYDWGNKDCGNIANGAMVLAWINGGCQAGWCGGAYWLPGQLRNDRNWFDPIEPSKNDLIAEIDRLREQVSSLRE